MSTTETIPSQKRLYLGRLPYGAVQKDIENFLRGYGHIERLVLKRGYAFVELDNARDAEDAVRDLNGRVMEKMNVVVDFAQTPLNWTTNYRDSSPSPMRLHSPMPVRSPSHDRDRVRRSPKAAEWYKDIHGAGSPSTRDHAHRSPRAAEWYRDVYAPRENYHGAGSPPGGGGGRGDTRIMVDEERRRIRRISRSPVRTRRPPPRYMRSRSRSPLLSSGTGIGGSSQHSHLPNLDDDGMDEYEEVDEGEYFFRLLDGRAELEAIAKEFTLEINIRTFDCSVAFGRTIPISNSKKVKEEPGAAGSSSSSSNAGANKLDKWIVFADRGPVVRVSNYEGTTLVKEHNVPKFEWEPFLGAIRGMCEKYLLGK